LKIAAVCAALSALLPGVASAQDIVMRRPIPHYAAPTPPAVISYPDTGTWEEQAQFVTDMGNVIRTEVKRFISQTGREPGDTNELIASSDKLKRYMASCWQGTPGCGPIQGVYLSRSWKFSPRWNAPGEYDTLYIVVFVNSYPYEPFCRAWAAAHPYDPDIYNGGGWCSSYYENHITIKL
jgi:hypothetical protein